ncbi:MAG: LysM peptidoglycan-binding domain-containing protein [Mariniblastus sp.]
MYSPAGIFICFLTAVLMSDPFSSSSKAQILREAQIGLSCVAVVLALFLYVAYYKISGRGRELPEHVRNAPVARTVWQGGAPADRSRAFEQTHATRLSPNVENQFNPSQRDSNFGSQAGQAASGQVASGHMGSSRNARSKLLTSSPEVNGFAADNTFKPNEKVSPAQPPARIASKSSFGAEDFGSSSFGHNGFQANVPEDEQSKKNVAREIREGIAEQAPVKLASAQSDIVTDNQFASIASNGTGESNKVKSIPSEFSPNRFVPKSKPAQGLPTSGGGSFGDQPSKGNVFSRLKLPESFGESGATKKANTNLNANADFNSGSGAGYKREVPAGYTTPVLRTAPPTKRVITTPKSSALDLVDQKSDSFTTPSLDAASATDLNFSSKPANVEGRTNRVQQFDRARVVAARDKSGFQEVRSSAVESLPESNFNLRSDPGSIGLRPQRERDASSPLRDAESSFEFLRSKAEPLAHVSNPTMTTPRPVVEDFNNNQSVGRLPNKFWPRRAGQSDQGNVAQGNVAQGDVIRGNVDRDSNHQNVGGSNLGDSKFTDSAFQESTFQKSNSTIVRASRPQSGSRNYKVQSGDSFWSIAEGIYQDGRYFRALYKYNEPTVPNFDELVEGVVIGTPAKQDLISLWPDLCPKPDSKLTTAGPSRTYLTRAGDTLFNIAREELGQASRFAEVFSLNQKLFRTQPTATTGLPAGVRLVLPMQ